MNLMELLDSKVKMNLPSLILKHMNRVVHQDKNDRSLTYGFWIGKIFEEFDVPIPVWEYQITKDVLGRFHHSSFPKSMKYAKT